MDCSLVPKSIVTLIRENQDAQGKAHPVCEWRLFILIAFRTALANIRRMFFNHMNMSLALRATQAYIQRILESSYGCIIIVFPRKTSFSSQRKNNRLGASLSLRTQTYFQLSFLSAESNDSRKYVCGRRLSKSMRTDNILFIHFIYENLPN